MISHYSGVMVRKLPLLISATLPMNLAALLLRMSTVIHIFSSSFSYLFLSQTNLLATLSANPSLKFQTKFSKSTWSPRSKQRGQNLSMSTPWLRARVRSLRVSPYLLVRCWLLLKWFTDWWLLSSMQLMSHILVVHLKLKQGEYTSVFSYHPLLSSSFLRSAQPPLIMKTLLLGAMPLFFFQIWISMGVYDFCWTSSQAYSSSHSESLGALASRFGGLEVMLETLDLYLIARSCSLVMWLYFCLPLSLPLLSSSFSSFYSTQLAFIGLASSSFLPFSEFMKSSLRLSKLNSDTIWYLKCAWMLLFSQMFFFLMGLRLTFLTADMRGWCTLPMPTYFLNLSSHSQARILNYSITSCLVTLRGNKLVSLDCLSSSRSLEPWMSPVWEHFLASSLPRRPSAGSEEYDRRMQAENGNAAGTRCCALALYCSIRQIYYSNNLR